MKIKYIKENYFKPIDTMKKKLDKPSNADKIRKESKEVLLQSILENVDIRDIYKFIFSIFSKNTEGYSKLYKGETIDRGDGVKVPIFYIINSYRIESDYINARLVNFSYSPAIDIGDFVCKEKSFVRISFKYQGSFDVINDTSDDYSTRYLDGRDFIKTHEQSPWPNPDIKSIQFDLEAMRKSLEERFPGVCFVITFEIQVIKGPIGFGENKNYKLAHTESDADKVIKDWKESNNQ